MKIIKILITVIITLIVVTDSIAEIKLNNNEKSDEQTSVLLDPANVEFSGYWGIYSRYGKISDSDGYMLGGRAGLIMNRNFVFGLGGMYLLSPKNMRSYAGDSYTGKYETVKFYYGGVLIEYYFNPRSLIVFSAGTLIGGGVVALSGVDDTVLSDIKKYKTNDKFATIEPELNIFINLTHSCRVGIGTSYRYVNGLKVEEILSKDFSGFTASVMVQIMAF